MSACAKAATTRCHPVQLGKHLGNQLSLAETGYLGNVDATLARLSIESGLEVLRMALVWD